MIPYRLIAGIALIASVLGGGAWWLHSVKTTAYDAGYAAHKAETTSAAFTQLEKVRSKESQLNDTNRKVANDYKAENDRLRADADDTKRLLYALQAAASSASVTDTSTITGVIDPYPRAFIECAVAIAEVDKEYQRVRGVANALQKYASEVCVSDVK
jgi:hypothetical protein